MPDDEIERGHILNFDSAAVEQAHRRMFVVVIGAAGSCCDCRIEVPRLQKWQRRRRAVALNSGRRDILRRP